MQNLSSILPPIFFFVGSDCLPVQKRSDSSQQPAWCRNPRPRSSQNSPCNENEKVRKYFLHESNPKGCKKFGICPNDAAMYDGLPEINYFSSFEACQMECMQRESFIISIASASWLHVLHELYPR